jgi:hypothetical protein
MKKSQYTHWLLLKEQNTKYMQSESNNMINLSKKRSTKGNDWMQILARLTSTLYFTELTAMQVFAQRLPCKYSHSKHHANTRKTIRYAITCAAIRYATTHKANRYAITHKANRYAIFLVILADF